MTIIVPHRFEDEYGYANEYQNDEQHKLLNTTTLLNEIDTWNGFFVEGLEDERFVDTLFTNISMEKSEQLDRKVPKFLPEELLENYRIMEEASQNNPLKILSTLEEKLRYIEDMEQIYQCSTKDHILYMKEKDYEGNVDERTWYRIGLQLQRDGLLEDRR